MGSLTRHIRPFRDDERGAMFVEMALVTPLLIALSAGVFEFGNFMHKKLLIEAGLRDAARYVARCRPLNSNACNTTARNIAATATADGTGAARVTGWAAGNVTVEPTHQTIAVTVDQSGNLNYRSSTSTVNTVRISTSYLYPDIGMLSVIGVGPITLTAAQEERYIGW